MLLLITRLRPVYDNRKYEFLLAKTVFYGESITVVEKVTIVCLKTQKL